VLQFGEALHQELKPHGVSVTALCPGASETAFGEIAGQKLSPLVRLMITEPHAVAHAAIAAMLARRATVMPGFLNRATVFFRETDAMPPAADHCWEGDCRLSCGVPADLLGRRAYHYATTACARRRVRHIDPSIRLVGGSARRSHRYVFADGVGSLGQASRRPDPHDAGSPSPSRVARDLYRNL